MKWNVLKQIKRVKTLQPNLLFSFLFFFLWRSCFPRRASCLACTCSLVPGGGDGEPVIDASPCWSRSARASCKKKRERPQRAQQGSESSEKGRTGRAISLSGEVISRCEALAGTEDISSGQGQADKECHIITSPYGLRPFDPISLWGAMGSQDQGEICSVCIFRRGEWLLEFQIVGLYHNTTAYTGSGFYLCEY